MNLLEQEYQIPKLDTHYTDQMVAFRLLFVAFFIFISICGARSQFIYYGDDGSSNLNRLQMIVESASVLRDSLQDLGYTANTFNIHNVADQLWMTVDGRFDVFEWRGSEWINIYEGTYHGYNFQSQKFTYNGRLFSYRGYGFWRRHGEIIEFLPEKGGWEIIPGTENLPYGVGYKLDSVYYIHAEECFEVEPITQTVRTVPCRYSIRGEVPSNDVYDFKDYILVTSNLNDGSQFPLIKKDGNQVYLSRRHPFDELRNPKTNEALILIQGNEMTIMYSDSSTVKYSVEDELHYYNLEPNTTDANYKWTWIVLCLVVLIMGFLTFRYSRTRRSKVKSELGILTLFNDHKGAVIDSDRLDQILSIDTITTNETRKHKRAALIREVNTLSKAQFGSDMITREKDPSDKRFYLYRIN